jgi:FkbM family methyltransferase
MGTSFIQKLKKKNIVHRLRRFYWQKRYRGKLEKEKVISVFFGDINIRLNEAVGGNIFSDNVHEISETNFLRNYCKEDFVCLDVGANIGYFSVLLGVLCPKGRVIAIEPIPKNAKFIKNNIDINNINNCDVECAALGDKNGESEFNLVTDTAFSGFRSTGRKVDSETITVKVLTPKCVLEKYDIEKIDLIKIDIEGAEPIVFKAFESVFKYTKPKYILSECNGKNLSTYGFQVYDFIGMMEKYGYDVFGLSESGHLESIVGVDEVFFDNVVFKLKE